MTRDRLQEIIKGHSEGYFTIEHTMSAVDAYLSASNGSKPDDSGGLPISKVVFFELKNGKYLADNGVELTTEFILKHEHFIFHDNGYVVIERQ